MDEIRIGTILHQALRVMARHPLLLIGLQTITFVDINILPDLTGAHWSPGNGTSADAPAWEIADGVVGILCGLVALIPCPITCHVASQAMTGKVPHLRDAIQTGSRRYFSVVGVIVVVSLRIVLGSLLLIVPGIINAIAAAVAIPACVMEDLAPFESIRRSTALTNGNRMKIFYLFLVPILGGAALRGLGLALRTQVEGIVPMFVNLFSRSVVQAYLTVLTVVLYYHLTALKEGREVPRHARHFSDPEARRPDRIAHGM